jgi:hypothetical protein
MSAVSRRFEFEAEVQSASSITGLPPMGLWESETLAANVDEFSAKTTARIVGEREFVEPDRARLLNSMCAMEGTECDRN